MDSNPNFKYTIYKTINKINGKIYIGCHKTINPHDNYIGSGTILKRAIKKYGRVSFQKEILFIFDTAEEMFSKESKIVDKLFVESDNTYNILLGGFGGFEYVNRTGKNLYDNIGDETHGKQNLWSGKKQKIFLIEHGLWEEWKKKVSEGVKAGFAKHGHPWIGRKHKESTKKIIAAKLSILQRGNNNSQYGTCWIYSNIEQRNKKIKCENLKEFLDLGWIKGRNIKY